MKKLFILTLALLFVAGFAYAEDPMFKLSGQYRWEMYSFTGVDYCDEDYNKYDYFDQRFRLRMDFMPAEGVQATVQGDYAEDVWGDYDYRPEDSGAIMIDKAYVDLTKSMVNIQAGLNGFCDFGNCIVASYQAPLVKVGADFAPVTVNAMWAKLSEGDAWTDGDGNEYDNRADGDDGDASADDDLMMAAVNYNAEAFSVGALYATRQDKAAEDTKNAIGVYGSASMGKISFWAEVDMLSGDDGNDVDYEGMNVSANASMDVNEQLSAGVHLFYAPGVDSSDGDKEQIAYLIDDWGYIPMDEGLGPFMWIEGNAFEEHEIEADAGAQGLSIYGSYKVMDDLTLWANVAYATPSKEDPDDNDVYVDSYTVMHLTGSYTFLPGTSFNLAYESSSRSGKEIDDDTQSKLMGMLKVSF
jgi:hypothetical protein